MMTSDSAPYRNSRFGFNAVLFALLIVLVVIIAAGTLWALVLRKGGAGAGQDGAPGGQTAAPDDLATQSGTPGERQSTAGQDDSAGQGGARGGAASGRSVADKSAQSASGGGELSPPPEPSIKTFGGIGRLRAPLKAEGGKTPATVVIELYFPYDSADRAFSEELAAHVRDFRAETLQFFAALPAASAMLHNDDAMKKELLKRYNSVLMLGRIKELYFTDFMVLD